MSCIFLLLSSKTSFFAETTANNAIVTSNHMLYSIAKYGLHNKEVMFMYLVLTGF